VVLARKESGMAKRWRIAELSGEQIRMVEEAEKGLGADYLVVFEEDQGGTPEIGFLTSGTVAPASLNTSQVECLHGLERALEAVAVAYRRVA
jgi:hypothetical protein